MKSEEVEEREKSLEDYRNDILNPIKTPSVGKSLKRNRQKIEKHESRFWTDFALRS